MITHTTTKQALTGTQTGMDRRTTNATAQLIGLGVLTRLFVDTTTQFFNPFLSIVAAGLNLSLVTMGQLVGLRNLLGLTAPLFGALADRHGYRRIMQLALLLCGVGTLLLASSRGLPLATAGMMLMGMGITGFIPTLQAYLSARLPYGTRARGLGIVEYGWALAGIVGLFGAGQLIAALDWRAPLYLIGGTLLLTIPLYQRLPAAHKEEHAPTAPATTNEARSLRDLLRFFQLGSNAYSAYATLTAGALFYFAAVQILITHGAWLRGSYGLGAAQLGTVAVALGLADLLGSGGASLFTDRLGKRRAVLLGFGLTMLACALLPLLDFGIVGAVTGLALLRGGFEFAFVSNIPLVSEQVPNQRGKLLALNAAFVTLGGAVAGFTGPWIYMQFGLQQMSLVSLAVILAAALLTIRQVKES